MGRSTHLKKGLGDRVRARMPLRYTSIILALLLGVVLPVLASTTAGILSITMGDSSRSLVIGVLVISFTAAAIGGVIATVVLLRRRARVARMQADLLANISHELKTPLAAIRMMAQTLQLDDASEDPERKQICLDTIVRQSRWLEDMIQRVLTWRSARGDRGGLEFVNATLHQGVELALERYQQMVEPGEDTLQVQLESQLEVEHDPEALATMVLNLLVNAYKYTPEEKNILVSLHDLDSQVVVQVQDNGPGVPENERRRIFEPFYRMENRLGSKAPGTGLGLAIVRHLAEVHGGEAGMDSGPEGGSQFWIKLPSAQGQHREREL